jgi:formyltetrahydrofolate deformylase
MGKDAHGIVAACTQVLGQHGCNIVKSEQWTDVNKNMFFQRLEFHYPSSKDSLDRVACEEELSQRLCRTQDDNMGWRDVESAQGCSKYDDGSFKNLSNHQLPLECFWNWRDRRKRVGIMVSKYDHCLWELLLRHSANELPMDIDMVISNHETLRGVAETFDIPFHVIPITAETKAEQEAKQLQLLKDVDVVVLARYMQVLSANFLRHFPNSILNIHHSFLPAFSGGSPYHVSEMKSKGNVLNLGALD